MAINQSPDWLNDLHFYHGVRCPGGKEILSPNELEAEITELQEGDVLVVAVYNDLAQSFTTDNALNYLKSEAQIRGENAVVDWCFANDRCGPWSTAIAALSGATPLETGRYKLDLEAAAGESRCQAESGGPEFDKVKSVCVQVIREFLRTYQK